MVVLTKKRFFVGEYNKLSAKKIGLVEIIEKINPNAYRLKLSSHICIADIFNVNHLIPYVSDSFDDDNSRVQPGQNDADEIACAFMEKFKKL